MGAAIIVSRFLTGDSFLRRKSMKPATRKHSVSIPFTSGNSFLHLGDPHLTEDNGYCVNPLHVGELISTRTSLMWLMMNLLCVNPLHVGELISTEFVFSRDKDAIVSIPFTSGNSFLPKKWEIELEKARSVSIPFTSGNSFLLDDCYWFRSVFFIVSIPFTSGNSFLHIARVDCT